MPLFHCVEADALTLSTALLNLRFANSMHIVAALVCHLLWAHSLDSTDAVLSVPPKVAQTGAAMGVAHFGVLHIDFDGRLLEIEITSYALDAATMDHHFVMNTRVRATGLHAQTDLRFSRSDFASFSKALYPLRTGLGQPARLGNPASAQGSIVISRVNSARPGRLSVCGSTANAYADFQLRGWHLGEADLMRISAWCESTLWPRVLPESKPAAEPIRRRLRKKALSAVTWPGIAKVA